MKKLFLIGFILITVYYTVASYKAEQLVFSSEKVKPVKEKLEKTEWKAYCRLEGKDMGERTSYEFNCNGQLEGGKEELDHIVKEFASQTPGLFVWSIHVYLSSQGWNNPVLEPISINGVDLYWPFR